MSLNVFECQSQIELERRGSVAHSLRADSHGPQNGFLTATRTHLLAFQGMTHTHTRSLLMSLSRRGLSLSDATDACRWSAHTRSLSMSLSRLYRCFRRCLSTTAARNRARRMQVEPRSRTARVWLVEEARVQHVKLSSAKACTHTHFMEYFSVLGAFRLSPTLASLY
jgi:hypothetical protein